MLCFCLALPSSRPASRVVALAREYLEETYIKFIKLTVYSNLSNASLGGIPGTFNLVR